MPTQEVQDRLNTAYSTLTAFFAYNATYDDGRDLLYQDFPSKYCFDKHRRWHRRRRDTTAIGRMFYYNPTAGERFYVRLLLTAVRGPTSFEHLRTVAGTLYPTFQAAYVALGLLDDDSEWINCLAEASVFAGGPQLRALFMTALVHGAVANPVALWDRFTTSICDDLPNVLARRDDLPASPYPDLHLDYGLFLLAGLLADHGRSLADYGLPIF